MQSIKFSTVSFVIVLQQTAAHNRRRQLRPVLSEIAVSELNDLTRRDEALGGRTRGWVPDRGLTNASAICFGFGI